MQLTNGTEKSEQTLSVSTTPSSKRTLALSDSSSEQSSSTKKKCLTEIARDLDKELDQGTLSENGVKDDMN